jgi:hypothetical protein
MPRITGTVPGFAMRRPARDSHLLNRGPPTPPHRADRRPAIGRITAFLDATWVRRLGLPARWPGA